MFSVDGLHPQEVLPHMKYSGKDATPYVVSRAIMFLEVFIQESLMAETGTSMIEHFKTDLWGASASLHALQPDHTSLDLVS
eukprot:2999343-Amphidinium_carterae.1